MCRVWCLVFGVCSHRFVCFAMFESFSGISRRSVYEKRCGEFKKKKKKRCDRAPRRWRPRTRQSAVLTTKSPVTPMGNGQPNPPPPSCPTPTAIPAHPPPPGPGSLLGGCRLQRTDQPKITIPALSCSTQLLNTDSNQNPHLITPLHATRISREGDQDSSQMS